VQVQELPVLVALLQLEVWVLGALAALPEPHPLRFLLELAQAQPRK
jgi:hypothetical protein